MCYHEKLHSKKNKFFYQYLSLLTAVNNFNNHTNALESGQIWVADLSDFISNKVDELEQSYKQLKDAVLKLGKCTH